MDCKPAANTKADAKKSKSKPLELAPGVENDEMDRKPAATAKPGAYEHNGGDAKAARIVKENAKNSAAMTPSKKLEHAPGVDEMEGLPSSTKVEFSSAANNVNSESSSSNKQSTMVSNIPPPASPTKPGAYSSGVHTNGVSSLTMMEPCEHIVAELVEDPQEDEEEREKVQEELKRFRDMEVATASAAVVMKDDQKEEAERQEEEAKRKTCIAYSMIIVVLVIVGAVIVALTVSTSKNEEPSSTGTGEVPTIDGEEPSPPPVENHQEGVENLTFGTGTALIMLDIQDCFMEASVSSTGETGSLLVPNTASLIPAVNEIRDDRGCLFDIVVQSLDFHPSNHISFASTHGLPAFAHLPVEFDGLGKGGLPITCLTSSTNPSCCPSFWVDQASQDCERVLCPNVTAMSSEMITHVLDSPACSVCMESPDRCFTSRQSMWPDHCVQGFEAGNLPPTLKTQDSDIIEPRGDLPYVDAYSAFWDNTRSIPTTLDQTLKSREVHTLYITGIATDFAVVHTARHAKALNYNTVVISDATRGISDEGTTAAILSMIEEGISVINSDIILQNDCPSG